MEKELQDKLYKKYPKIFAQKDLNVRQSCMPWGFECGSGWYWLIDNLCEAIQNRVKWSKIKQIEAVQVKEKFGGLRFYTNFCDNEIDAYISFVEHLSYKICEQCGSTEDVIQTEGWIRSVCKKCIDKERVGTI